MAATVGHDDYALKRVPQAVRYHWFSVAMQRFGQLSALPVFLIGATLGFGMPFWDALLAITLGAAILQVLVCLTGIIGQREGLSTSVLCRWTGFGSGGSALIGLIIAVSAIGWFGINNAVSAEALAQLIGVLPVWGWALVFGSAVTGIVIVGFRMMAWTAYVTVPIFLLLVGWSITAELSTHSFSSLLATGPAGQALSLVEGTTIVAGGYIVGAVISPDMSRYNRSSADVVKQTVLGIALGEYVIAMSGVLLALALKTNDVISIVTSTSGFIGAIVVISATLKINDWNLYAVSLGTVNFIDQVFGRRVNRALVTLVAGLSGSILAAVGILTEFTTFLTLLGVAFPPVAGIMVAEYFVVRTWRANLDADRTTGELPASAPTWVPATLVIWAIASAVGWLVKWGLPSINSLVIAMVLYVVAGRLGLIRGVGTTKTDRAATPSPSAVAPVAGN